MYRHVLVTLDGSEASEAVLAQAARLADGAAAKITLLAVSGLPQAVSEAPGPRIVAGAPASGAAVSLPEPRVFEDRGQAIERSTDELREYLEAKAAKLRAAGIEVETRVAFGDPVEEILAAAREQDIDLIMMATHGRTGLARVIFGSVAARVVGSGVRPVLLVRPHGLSSSDRT